MSYYLLLLQFVAVLQDLAVLPVYVSCSLRAERQEKVDCFVHDPLCCCILTLKKNGCDGDGGWGTVSRISISQLAAHTTHNTQQ